MARIPTTSPLYGAQGLVGGLLFRTVGGKTVVSAYEGPRKKRKQSELQQLTRSRFAEATRYAKGIMRDPVKYEYYKKKAKKLGVTSAYTAAITEFMRKPRVEGCLTTISPPTRSSSGGQSRIGGMAPPSLKLELSEQDGWDYGMDRMVWECGGGYVAFFGGHRADWVCMCFVVGGGGSLMLAG